MSRHEIMGLKWYVVGFGKAGKLGVGGSYPDMDSADEAGLELFGMQKDKPHRNYLIIAEWSRDLPSVTEKVVGILKHGKFTKRSIS